MANEFNLDRFVTAQNPFFARVRHEIGPGREPSHRMWFIFPRLQGLGSRIPECTGIVVNLEGKTACEIFGTPDDLIFQSSMMLFAAVPAVPSVFRAALEKYFWGIADARPIELLEPGARR